MNPTSSREEAIKQLHAQLDALPDDNPRKLLLTQFLAKDATAESKKAQQERLRQLAWERYSALPDTDPLKAVLGKLLNGSEPAPSAHAPGGGEDVWGAVDALRQRDEVLFKGMQTVDARSAAAMQETMRLAAKSVELQELLNMVLEEVHANTAMLKNLKEVLPARP